MRTSCSVTTARGHRPVPDYPAIHTPGLVVSFVAEVGLALGLLVKGVKVVDAGTGRGRQEDRRNEDDVPS